MLLSCISKQNEVKTLRHLLLPCTLRNDTDITARLCFMGIPKIFAHGRDTSWDKTRLFPRLCLCVPQTLCAVSRQVQRNSEVCRISINFSEPLTLKVLLDEILVDEITLETYNRPGSKKYFARLFIGLCS